MELITSHGQSVAVKEHKVYLTCKRILDVLLSGIAIIILLPIFLLVMALIILDDPGASPVFSQVRIGKNNKPFRFYKFRSMVHNAEELKAALEQQNEMEGPAFKMKNDPRITRFGKFIRRTSIDELPQLWNIFLGDMSIVGPRPPLPNEVEQYTPYQLQRLSVTPGLTCYWQVQKQRNSFSFDEWLALDLKYIVERNILVDLKVILLTIKAVLGLNGV